MTAEEAIARAPPTSQWHGGNDVHVFIGAQSSAQRGVALASAAGFFRLGNDGCSRKAARAFPCASNDRCRPLRANSMKARVGHRWLLAVLLGLSLLVSACGNGPPTSRLSERQIKAQAMFAERCKMAGEKIRKIVENVEGVYLLKIRPTEVNYGDQFKLDDPYGKDLGGLGYVQTFVRDSYKEGHRGTPLPGSEPPPIGYGYVEASDLDGTRYRYTGRIEEPWQQERSYFKGYTRFVLDRTLAVGPALRYGVTYDDISTREEREYWIAGSSLKVIDLQTREVIAERVGYMMDWAQGHSAGGRSPWLWAFENACPGFKKNPNRLAGPASASTGYQAARFVEKVLKPSLK